MHQDSRLGLHKRFLLLHVIGAGVINVDGIAIGCIV